VLDEIGASYTSLGPFFGSSERINKERIATLLTSMKRHTKSVAPKLLGVIGKEHLLERFAAAGGEPKTFKYILTPNEENGVPRLIEVAFGQHKKAFEEGVDSSSRMITRVNWSPAIHNPFRAMGTQGEGLDTLLESLEAGRGEPVIDLIHLACPRVQYTDRGKSAIVCD
jgi:hypothetical protein